MASLTSINVATDGSSTIYSNSVFTSTKSVPALSTVEAGTVAIVYESSVVYTISTTIVSGHKTSKISFLTQSTVRETTQIATSPRVTYTVGVYTTLLTSTERVPITEIPLLYTNTSVRAAPTSLLPSSTAQEPSSAAADAPTSTHKARSAGVIAGAAVGTFLIVLIIVVVAFRLARRRRQSRREGAKPVPTPPHAMPDAINKSYYDTPELMNNRIDQVPMAAPVTNLHAEHTRPRTEFCGTTYGHSSTAVPSRNLGVPSPQPASARHNRTFRQVQDPRYPLDSTGQDLLPSCRANEIMSTEHPVERAGALFQAYPSAYAQLLGLSGTNSTLKSGTLYDSLSR